MAIIEKSLCSAPYPVPFCLFSSPEPKAYWWAYRIDGPPSSVCRPSVCRPHTFNIFSSETAWPIKVNFRMEPPCDRGTNVCSNGPGHMTKMAAMPVYLLLRNQKADDLESWYRVLEYYQVCSNEDPELTLTYFTARSDLVPYAFLGLSAPDLRLYTFIKSSKGSQSLHYNKCMKISS